MPHMMATYVFWMPGSAEVCLNVSHRMHSALQLQKEKTPERKFLEWVLGNKDEE